ncbi:Protein of unknown function [Acetoanaerobium noterae]|uniref:DUF2000 domain-containing protein n=1 Tax=Acetoanaerobium noterae TaxID=745369 RepID=A0A1T5CZ80_9FIRM|nr:DUF2000 domain-containing protein [Acetoanaerobium noterae]SKB64782.1 Protein of unknown function [Acetoanaerobium noterae]
MKCVMIVNENLPRGIIANTTAALGISIASLQDGMTGKKLVDRNGRIHESITNVPIPILALPVNDVKVLYDNLLELNDEDLKVIGFNDVAQNSHHYEEYEARLLQTAKDNINYLGICRYGPKKKINRLTGSMKMLR